MNKMTAKNDEFAPLPVISQTSTSNAAWVAVTTTKEYADGSKSQTFAVEPKPRIEK
jgi:hypothetical protein